MKTTWAVEFAVFTAVFVILVFLFDGTPSVIDEARQAAIIWLRKP